MVQYLKQYFGVAILAAGLADASAFVLLGPNNDDYQDPAIGYNPNANLGDSLETGPKAIGEEYRRNTPYIYYSFDQNFLEYFGSNGVVAVEEAMAMLNSLTDGTYTNQLGISITNFSLFSSNLAEVPLEGTRVNLLAQTLGISDLKSFVLFLMMEQLGLSEADRYVWALHGRENDGTAPCPAGMIYTVIKRNLDPVLSGPTQSQYSSYVNETLLSYQIVEYCGAADSPVPPLEADAREFQVDPFAPRYTPISSRFNLLNGSYHIGLTRDDVGGLRYLMRSNNINFENTGPGTVTFVTNATPEYLLTSDLRELLEAAFVSDAGDLQGQFPGIQITSTTPIFTNVVTTNVNIFFTNYPWSPAGSLASIASNNIVTTNAVIRYRHTFGNVVTNSYATNGLITVVTTNISAGACPPFTPAGYICTIVTSNNVLTNGIFGDYYLLPTNVCDIYVMSTQLITAVPVTISSIVATNQTATNVLDQTFSRTVGYTFNQHVLLVRNVNCPEDTLALRQGMERIQFIRRDYDSLIGSFFAPTNSRYVLNAVTNNSLRPQYIVRTVTEPDILFTAEDFAEGPGGTIVFDFDRNVNFNTDNTLANMAGPGTIFTPTVVTFNRVGPAYRNTSTSGFLEANNSVLQIWGSFDGSTNTPVVYPNGTDIENIINQIFIQVTPQGGTNLPNGQIGVPYTNVFSGFTVTGGTPPHSWALGPNSFGLPPGLVLTGTSATITGVPISVGTFDFVVRVEDANGRYVDGSYTITITP
jgi:hypothetical protein